MGNLSSINKDAIIFMSNAILKDKNTSLCERGLLVTLIANLDKSYAEISNELQDKQKNIDSALDKLEDDGYAKKDTIDGEEIIRISDKPKYLEG